ncbi:hypothetical protein [Streptomyces megasporus]|uniref:hypothetical protein n=1 Tax=Streptomyces megasporus TaxID=44060 RepID=UPI0004E0BDFA|nr:hypothetical protein [Streptomyces megasporus]
MNEPENGTGTTSEPHGEPHPKAGRSRRALLPALAALLVLGAVGGGLAYTKRVVDGADRSAPAEAWKKPAKTPSDDDPVQDPEKGRSDSALRKKLLPVPDYFALGPDIAEFGNDAELSGRQARALMEESGRGLPPKQRREHREYVDKLRLQGVVMRSYVSDTHGFVAEIQIARMTNEKAVRDMSGFRSELLDALSVFRDGPRIKGHENAECFLPPKDDETDLESMFCTAHQGELLVSYSVDGTKPFPKKDAAELLKDQLDHLESPGEYI